MGFQCSWSLTTLFIGFIVQSWASIVGQRIHHGHVVIVICTWSGVCMSKGMGSLCLVRGSDVHGHGFIVRGQGFMSKVMDSLCGQGFICPRSWIHCVWSGVHMSKVMASSCVVGGSYVQGHDSLCMVRVHMYKVMESWCMVRGSYVQGHDSLCMVMSLYVQGHRSMVCGQGFVCPRS